MTLALGNGKETTTNWLTAHPETLDEIRAEVLRQKGELGGACPLDRKVAGGRIWDLTTYTTIERHNVTRMAATKFVQLVGRSIPGVPVIPTPEEEDFFAALGVPCWLPEQRTVYRLMQFISPIIASADASGASGA